MSRCRVLQGTVLFAPETNVYIDSRAVGSEDYGAFVGKYIVLLYSSTGSTDNNQVHQIIAHSYDVSGKFFFVLSPVLDAKREVCRAVLVDSAAV